MVVTEGARELGEKIDQYLISWAEDSPEATESFLIDCECPRFSSGDGKGIIKETVRGMDLYFLVDVGNYNCKYTIFGHENCMSPDDHFQDLKRLIQASGGKANSYYSSVLEVNLGMFYKRRDYSRVVNGRNPIVAHEYLGDDVTGKTLFIADDIISSGESSLDIAYELKKRKADKIFVFATCALFTNGLEDFDKAYEDGVISGVFGTNLTYRTEDLKRREWFYEVDCSKYIAYIIAALYHQISISALLDPHKKIKALLAGRQ
ncbi:MAG: ribose-phosphate pyrophosphokinase-like domain-containing protein [Eubacteriales bacterium]|nr:ribose-phosphate pyrophosphokinase-like domain-containing protein [Eubacteriales bacterium]